MKTYRPLLLFAALLLIVGLACNAAGGGSPAQTEAPQQPAQQPTKEEPAPTEAPATEAPATEEPTATESPATEAPAEAPAFYTEEFDGDLSNWTYWVIYGDENGVGLNADNSKLNVSLTAGETSVYVFYDPYIYEDVILEVQADNAGKNNNNVSLVCRYDEAAETWYEFSIANNGLYWIYAYDGGYNEVHSGGSNLIKTGKNTNIYTVGCIGNVLSLFINGEEVHTFQETTYGLKEGQVGINVTSFDVLPIEIDFEYLTISEP